MDLKQENKSLKLSFDNDKKQIKKQIANDLFFLEVKARKIYKLQVFN